MSRLRVEGRTDSVIAAVDTTELSRARTVAATAVLADIRPDLEREVAGHGAEHPAVQRGEDGASHPRRELVRRDPPGGAGATGTQKRGDRGPPPRTLLSRVDSLATPTLTLTTRQATERLHRYTGRHARANCAELSTMEVLDSAIETALRLRIIDEVLARAEMNGGFLTREELLEWNVGGERVPVIDFSRGIRNPANFSSTLAIVSTVGGPYDDIESHEDGLLHYNYRKGDPWGGDNRKLRNALETGAPLILFRKEIKGILTPTAPVYVVDDEPESNCFVIALDEAFRFFPRGTAQTEEQKRYALRLARQRLHQPAFRTRVLMAYDSRCTVCELKHAALLDAAHIVADSDPRGRAAVTNGLALCKIHHAAFDQQMLGVSPDYRIRISTALLAEIDGPMLKHGLQEMDGRTLALPKRRADRPDRDALAARFAEFAERL